MSCLLRRGWYLAANKLSELHKNPTNWRAQQSYAAAPATVNSSNESHPVIFFLQKFEKNGKNVMQFQFLNIFTTELSIA